MVENQLGKKIKVLRTDNGGEFCSDKFEQFCVDNGIARQKMTPYTSQQTRVAERLNRSLIKKVRCMLSWAGLGPEFWVEIIATASYLKNRSLTSSVKDRTPYEVVFGKKPNLSHVRVFGCDAYVHVPKEKRGKLDNKFKKNIFVGYKKGVKGYKPWNLESNTIVYSRDVVFHESQPQVCTQKGDEPKKVIVLEESLEIETMETVPQDTLVESDIESDQGDSVNEVEDADSDEDLDIDSMRLLGDQRWKEMYHFDTHLVL